MISIYRNLHREFEKYPN